MTDLHITLKEGIKFTDAQPALEEILGKDQVRVRFEDPYVLLSVGTEVYLQKVGSITVPAAIAQYVDRIYHPTLKTPIREKY